MSLSRMLIGWGFFVAVMGCKPKAPASSDPRVINGKQLSDADFPAVVAIHRHTTTGYEEFSTQVCTGTFLSKRVLITAAHCVTDEVQDDGLVKNPGRERVSGAIPARIFVHAGYKGSAFDPLHDVALFEFSHDVAPAIAKISARPAKEGDIVEIVGFGRHDPSSGESAGVKRWGTNKLESAGDTLRFRGLAKSESFDGKDTASAKGDSGGPMFLEGDLIGTTVGGAVDEERKISEYTHLHALEIRKFLTDAQSRGIEFDLPDGYVK